MATASQHLDDPRLLQRRELGEDGGRLHPGAKVLLRDGLDLRAQQDSFHRQPNIFAGLAGDHLIVTGEHLDGHAAAIEFLDGLGR